MALSQASRRFLTVGRLIPSVPLQRPTTGPNRSSPEAPRAAAPGSVRRPQQFQTRRHFCEAPKRQPLEYRFQQIFGEAPLDDGVPPPELEVDEDAPRESRVASTAINIHELGSEAAERLFRVAAPLSFPPLTSPTEAELALESVDNPQTLVTTRLVALRPSDMPFPECSTAHSNACFVIRNRMLQQTEPVLEDPEEYHRAMFYSADLESAGLSESLNALWIRAVAARRRDVVAMRPAAKEAFIWRHQEARMVALTDLTSPAQIIAELADSSHGVEELPPLVLVQHPGELNMPMEHTVPFGWSELSEMQVVAAGCSAGMLRREATLPLQALIKKLGKQDPQLEAIFSKLPPAKEIFIPDPEELEYLEWAAAAGHRRGMAMAGLYLFGPNLKALESELANPDSWLGTLLRRAERLYTRRLERGGAGALPAWPTSLEELFRLEMELFPPNKDSSEHGAVLELVERAYKWPNTEGGGLDQQAWERLAQFAGPGTELSPDILAGLTGNHGQVSDRQDSRREEGGKLRHPNSRIIKETAPPPFVITRLLMRREIPMSANQSFGTGATAWLQNKVQSMRSATLPVDRTYGYPLELHAESLAALLDEEIHTGLQQQGMPQGWSIRSTALRLAMLLEDRRRSDPVWRLHDTWKERTTPVTGAHNFIRWALPLLTVPLVKLGATRASVIAYSAWVRTAHPRILQNHSVRDKASEALGRHDLPEKRAQWIAHMLERLSPGRVLLPERMVRGILAALLLSHVPGRAQLAQGYMRRRMYDMYRHPSIVTNYMVAFPMIWSAMELYYLSTGVIGGVTDAPSAVLGSLGIAMVLTMVRTQHLAIPHDSVSLTMLKLCMDPAVLVSIGAAIWTASIGPQISWMLPFVLLLRSMSFRLSVSADVFSAVFICWLVVSLAEAMCRFAEFHPGVAL